MHKDREQLISQISTNTLNFRIKQWVDNFKTNLKLVKGAKGIASLASMGKGIPAAIVGSGPTLDRNIKDVRLLQGKAIIIACDSAVKALLDAGAKPDIVVVTDSKERVAKFFDDMSVEELNFVVDTFVHPSTAERLLGAKRLYWYSTLPIQACPFSGALNEWTGYIGNLGTGGCVATTAWWLAVRHLLCDPDILVGLPESFYDPAHMYAQSVAKSVETEPYTSSLIECTDIFGRPCYTFPALQSFAWWFQDAFLQVPGIHINCSEGGILSENCLNMPLLAVVQKYLAVEYDIEGILFTKERIVERICEHVDHDLSEETRNMLMILLDGPSQINLALRMGWTKDETLERINEFRNMGFLIDETETKVEMEGAEPQTTQVFMLKGLSTPAVKLQIKTVDGRPTLLELTETTLDAASSALLQALSQHEGGLPVRDLVRLTGLEEGVVVHTLHELERKNVVKHTERGEADALFELAVPVEGAELVGWE